MNHLKLTEEKQEKIEYELKKSKEQIEDHIGNRVKSFCYPYAFPDQDKIFVRALLSLMERIGYEIGVTTRVGLAYSGDNIFALKRMPINEFDDQVFLVSKLTGAYDWIQKFQLVYKKIKRDSGRSQILE